MSENEDEPRDGEQFPPPPWIDLTAEHLVGIAFEAPISTIPSADCGEYSDAFRKAADEAISNGDEAKGAVFSALSAVCSFHFRADNVNDAFGPLMVFENRRSPIPEDFRGNPAQVLALMAARAQDVALKARLCDVAWLLDKRRVDLGRQAILAYVGIIHEVMQEKRKFRFSSGNDPLSHTARDIVKRALLLSAMRSVGRDTDEQKASLGLAETLVSMAQKGTNPTHLHRLYELALQFDIVAPVEIGAAIEGWLQTQGNSLQNDSVLDLQRLAASAYRAAGSNHDYNRSKIMVANTLREMAEAALRDRSAMLASSFIADAISELHGVPDVRDKRLELRHRLVDIQVNISDEMQTFSQELDLKEIAEGRIASLQDLSLRDALFLFAAMSRSPSPEKLQQEAIASIQEHPLSSLFASSFHDREGKVVYRSDGADLSATPNPENLKGTISRAEQIRRLVFAQGEIRPARRAINERFFISDDSFTPLMFNSEFVPPNLVDTYCRGFRRFFQGDAISAIYILTPLLEASIRHVMKAHGHDVSVFDNATKTQQDLTISAMFLQLRTEITTIFGDEIVTDIENTFLDKPGPTIRHDVAHGLLSDGDPFGPDETYACWFIFRLCLIPLFPHVAKFDDVLWQ